MTTLDIAREYAAGGLSTIPIRPDGSKAPSCAWRPYQEHIPTPDELSHMFSNGAGIAVVAGKVSGNLECLDFEAAAGPLFDAWCDLIRNHDPELADRLVIIGTPSGGHHVLYRCPDGVESNQKLAMRPGTDANGQPTQAVLIETRGEGGYFLTVGSPARCHAAGKPYTLLQGDLVPGAGEHAVPSITASERELLLDAARSFNEVRREAEPVRSASAARPDSPRPGDDFAARTVWGAILEPYGWKPVGGEGDVTYWRRPGKDEGLSATTNFGGSDCLYVFSSNAHPFEPETSYTKFAAYAVLNHGGDFQAAARELGRKGYGTPDTRPQGTGEAIPDNHHTVPDDENRPTRYSDDALADQFSIRYADRLRYVPTWGWLEWDGIRWRRVASVRVMDLARTVCRSAAGECLADPELKGAARTLARGLASAKTVAAVERLAQGDPRHYSEPQDWDSDLWLFNTPGGTVDLRTGQLRQHNRDDRITKVANATPRGECPRWMSFLARVTAGNAGLAGYTQRLAGYAMAGDPREECVDFFHGPGGNGKGTFLGTIRHVFGEYATTAGKETFAESKTDKHPTDIAKLAGVRLVISNEVDEGQRWDEARIKDLTGRDELTARYMRQDFFTFMPQFTLIIAGNHRPSLKNVDESIRRRFHLVPFDVVIPADERDEGLKEALRAEADGILAWAVQGCLDWQRQKLNPPAAVLDATAEYLEEEDTFSLWLVECCQIAADLSEPTNLLYESFRQWKQSRGEGVPGRKTFNARMRDRGFQKSRSASARGYAGLELNSDERLAVQAAIASNRKSVTTDRMESTR